MLKMLVRCGMLPCSWWCHVEDDATAPLGVAVDATGPWQGVGMDAALRHGFYAHMSRTCTGSGCYGSMGGGGWGDVNVPWRCDMQRATTWVLRAHLAVDAMGPWGWRAALENNVMRCVSVTCPAFPAWSERACGSKSLHWWGEQKTNCDAWPSSTSKFLGQLKFTESLSSVSGIASSVLTWRNS